MSFVLVAGSALAERRVALVIGEDGYKTIRKLDNAVDDAKSVSDTLEQLGFEVTLETNRDLKRVRRALDDFRDDGAGPTWRWSSSPGTASRSPATTGCCRSMPTRRRWTR